MPGYTPNILSWLYIKTSLEIIQFFKIYFLLRPTLLKLQSNSTYKKLHNFAICCLNSGYIRIATNPMAFNLTRVLKNWTKDKIELQYIHLKRIKRIKHEWNLILAVCFQLKQLKKQPEKNSGLNGIRTHDLAIPVQCSIHWATKPHG